MKQVRRLSTLWNWLPAFRAVAETEHLPTASDALNVSASALSRSIRLLEEDVGQELFDRVGRSIHLNAAGHKLLGSVRSAMRLIDEGLQTVGSGQLVGSIRISVPGPFAPVFVLPALPAVVARHPELTPVLCSHPAVNIPQQLLRGRIDLALLDDPLACDEIETEELGPILHGLYCGHTHPLATVAAPKPTEIARHPFVAPNESEAGLTPDAWPVHRPRIVGLRTTQMQTAIEAVERGEFLAVLPCVVAERARLHRVELDPLRPTTLIMARRPGLGITSRVEVVADAVRAVFTELQAQGRSTARATAL